MVSTFSEKKWLPYAGVWLSGLMLWLAWPPSGWCLLLFVAWVPLLIAEQKIKSPYGLFFTLWGSLLLWNAGTTWWIWNSTPPGAVGAIVANSLIMCAPILLYRTTRQKLGTLPALWALPLYWLAYEYLHHNWELSWPWLTLGNAFAARPSWVLWYAYTGTAGGTAWVWLVNMLVAGLILYPAGQGRQSFGRYSLPLLALLPIPLGILLQQPAQQADASGNVPNVVVVQPNVEAYDEKFNTDPADLAAQLIRLSQQAIDSQTRMVVWPETALPIQAWEHELPQHPVVQQVAAFLQAHPRILLVTGIDSYKLWGSTHPGGFSIRQMTNGEYYEAFNTAMGWQHGAPFTLYHKSKLVPGVEALPSWLSFMSSLFSDFGGISGSLGRSPEAMAFSAEGNPYKPAPIICYESIYSQYVTDYIRSGANVLTVITNDGWWGNTPGYHQHMQYARLRAIETGLWVARSANTGISCFIDPAGHVYQPQPWDTEAAIKMAIPPVSAPSWYARTGNVLSMAALGLAAAFFLLTITTCLWKKR